MTTEADLETSFYPDLRDPRVMVSVPHPRRAAMSALWGLAARLTKLLIDAREPLIGQIKLAWWRDMAAMIEKDPGALPKGEPLLAELQATWAGRTGLDALVDAAEAIDSARCHFFCCGFVRNIGVNRKRLSIFFILHVSGKLFPCGKINGRHQHTRPGIAYSRPEPVPPGHSGGPPPLPAKGNPQ